MKKLVYFSLLALALSSCTRDKDMYQEPQGDQTSKAEIDANVEKVFGTTFDPNQDWQMMKSAQVTIKANVTDISIARVQVLTANPFIPSADARVLNEAPASYDKEVTLLVDVPNYLDTLYAACVSPEGYYRVTPFTLNDPKVSFPEANTRSTRAAVTTPRVISEGRNSDNVNMLLKPNKSTNWNSNATREDQWENSGWSDMFYDIETTIEDVEDFTTAERNELYSVLTGIMPENTDNSEKVQQSEYLINTANYFFADGSQLEATFQNGEAEGSVEWKKNGLPYYQGEWTDGGPSGFGVLYSKAGKKIYEGPFLGGTIDGRSLLGYSADELREAFCESTLKSERVDDGYRILAEELGVTALCTFQTEGEPSTVYQIYLAAPAKSDWVTILPGMEHTRGVQWPPDVTPIQRTIRYIGQYGVNVEAGTYYAENALEEDWRTTALYADETRQQVVLLTWVRSDVTPIPLDIGGGSAGEDSVEAFLDALDQMDATAGSDLGEGAVFGSADPDSLLSGMADASEAVSLADAMIRRWELTEELSALTEAFDRTGVLLEDVQDQISKGLASAEAVTELEQEQLELTSRIEACRTELKRSELQTDAAGIEDLGDYALGDMLVEFDPAEQDFSALSLVAVAYAQATGSSRDAGEVQNEVKESLLDLTDAYGEVKLALAHYQNLVSNTKNEASAYAMGLGSKEAWYGAMNRQTLGRIELCGALAAFSRLANSFNQLTGGWVSRTFDWHRDSFETLFLADVLPVEVFAEAAAEAAGKAAAEAEKAAAAAEEAQKAASEAEGNAMAEYAAKQPAEEAKQAALEAAAAAALAQSAAETAADASMRASLAASSAEAAVQASRAESAAEEASSASEQAREAQAAAEEAAKKAAEIAAMAAAERAAAAQEGGVPPHG